MNTLFRVARAVLIPALLLVSCSFQAVQGQPDEQITSTVFSFGAVLGKPLTDQVVIDFLAEHHCTSAAQFQICEDAGMALIINLNQIVEAVYLYLNEAVGFRPYEGELPLGLKFYDTMGAVVYKLGRQGIGHDGAPDQACVPDHFHYQAVYKEAGVTILYNSPFADEDATIYAITVNS